MRLGRLLNPEMMNLEMYDSHFGLRFLAADRDSGRDIIIPNTVDTKAIFRVSITPIHAVEQVNSNGARAVHTGYT